MDINDEIGYVDELEQEPISYQFQYRLDRGGNKFNCPSCGTKMLNRFIDKNGYYSFSDEGICDNIDCGYQKIPAYYPNGIERYEDLYDELKKGYYDTIEDIHLVESMYECHTTNSAKFLTRYLGEDEAVRLVTKYKVGKAISDNELCDIFWRLDRWCNIKNGKLVRFNRRQGKISDINTKNWISTFLWGVENPFNSFFGEHLLDKTTEKSIAIVENEMTAIICDYFWPEFVWIAIGGIDEICWNRDMYFVECLKQKNVIIFPDSTIPCTQGEITFLEWHHFAEAVIDSFQCNITIGSLLKDLIPKLSCDSGDKLYKLLCYNLGSYVYTEDLPF